MKKKIINFVFIFSILTFIFFLVFISFNSNFRRNVLVYTFAGAKLYHTISIKSSLGSEPNIEEASNKLLKFIKFADYFSEGKNSFHSSIFEMAETIENAAITKNEYLYLSEIVSRLIKKDPDLYLAKIWAAKISMLKNENKKLIFDYLNQAIDLSPAREEAYRLALNFSFKINEKELFNTYCKKYHNSNLGGHKPRFEDTNFYGYSISKFAIEILPEDKEVKYYTMEGLSLNTSNNYYFSISESKNLSGINIYTSFLPGVKIEIDEINLIDVENIKFKIPIEQIYSDSNFSYLDNTTEKLTYYVFREVDEKIYINFSKEYQNITKINIKIKFSRLNLNNTSNCSND